MYYCSNVRDSSRNYGTFVGRWKTQLADLSYWASLQRDDMGLEILVPSRRQVPVENIVLGETSIGASEPYRYHPPNPKV